MRPFPVRASREVLNATHDFSLGIGQISVQINLMPLVIFKYKIVLPLVVTPNMLVTELSEKIEQRR